MQATKLVGILLIIAGTLGLVYGGFSYTEESTAAKIGTLEITVDQEKDVNVPMWGRCGCHCCWCFAVACGWPSGLKSPRHNARGFVPLFHFNFQNVPGAHIAN